MKRLLNLERRHGKPFWLAMGVASVAALGLVDFLTGYEVSLALFYLVPVLLVTWTVGLSFGIAVSLLCAAVCQVVDLAAGHEYSHPAIPVWNALIRLGFFVITTSLLSSLRRLLQGEQEMARRDSLTGAVNSRCFYELAQSEVDRSRRYKRPLTIAYLDLDNFKAVNDRFGHQVGDKVLSAVVRYLQRHLRKTDVVARLGGDEFALLLPETGREAAEVVVSKVRAGLVEEMRQNDWPTTFSIGVLTCSAAPESTDEAVRLADNLMYSIKNAGKDDVVYETYPA